MNWTEIFYNRPRCLTSQILSKIDIYSDSFPIIFYFVVYSITYLITFIWHDKMACAELTVNEQSFLQENIFEAIAQIRSQQTSRFKEYP